MSYNDPVTIKAFSTALENLNQPLPEDVQAELGTTQPPPNSRLPRLIRDLGWTPEQVIETRSRLLAFEEDWNAPGMEAYDDL